MPTMTPKERALAAFAHQIPDRVPIDYFCNAGIDRRLRAHFGVSEHDGEGLLKALGVDFRYVWPRYIGKRLHPEVPGRHVDPISGIRTRWIEHASGGYWDFCDFPLADASDEQLDNWPIASADDFDYAGMREQCLRHKDFCIILGNAGVGDIINSTGMVRTMEQVLIDLATDNAAYLRYVDRKVNLDVEVLRRSLAAAEGLIDVAHMGEDLGTQIGPMISLEMYRKHLRPRHQRIIDVARHHSRPVMVHCCGSSSWAFDDFIEMGVGIVDTLQPEAKEMSPAYLKQRYGKRLAFHGCISTAGPVATGTVADVVRDVRQTLEIMMPGGGYALSPTHCLQDNSPTENVVAMYETAKMAGRYAKQPTGAIGLLISGSGPSDPRQASDLC